MKNNLIKYRFGGSGNWAEIKYDALGRVRERISADETPITNKFYYDGRQLIQQLNDFNDAEFDYLRGPTGLDRQWDETNDTRRFYIKDNLGTVWAIVNPSDLSVKRYNYNAWGEHLDPSDTNFPDYNDDPNIMRYIGCKVETFATGWETQKYALYHLDHRHYLPVLGKFLQREPFAIADDVHAPPYIYSNNRPSIATDPMGLFSGTCSPTGGCGPWEQGKPSEELWAPGHIPGEQPTQIGAPHLPPVVGEGTCCRVHEYARTILDKLKAADRMSWISNYIIIGGATKGQQISIEFEGALGKFHCILDVWFIFFYWFCDYKYCPTKKEEPCWELKGEIKDIAKWIISSYDIGFYWQNRESKPMTRTMHRVELKSCEGLKPDDPMFTFYAWQAGFTKGLPGNITLNLIKNFCQNLECNCPNRFGVGFAITQEIMKAYFNNLKEYGGTSGGGGGLRWDQGIPGFYGGPGTVTSISLK